MQFIVMDRVYPDIPMWGARQGAFTFIITQDDEGKFTASVKVVGAPKFDGSRMILGGYRGHATLEDAKDACKKLYKERH